MYICTYIYKGGKKGNKEKNGNICIVVVVIVI